MVKSTHQSSLTMYQPYIDYSMAVEKLHRAFPKVEFSGAIITGSGGPDLREYQVPNTDEISYQYLHPSLELSVPKHEGKVYLIQRRRRPRSKRFKYFLVFQGRVHFYECGNIQKVAAIAHLIAAAKIPKVLITNAAGTLYPKSYKVGSIVGIEDVDWDSPMDPMIPWNLNYIVPKLTLPNKKFVKDSTVYYAVTGPTFETGARATRLMRGGAAIVGMSTVPEIIVCSLHGIEVTALSLITNVIHLTNNHEVSHEGNIAVAETQARKFRKTIFNLL